MTELRFHDVGYRTRGEVALITMDNPPVNGLNLGIRSGLIEAMNAAVADTRIAAIVLCGAGRGFSAGGDIKEFGTPAASQHPQLSRDVHPVIESSDKPVIAAMHGLAIGGGLETAMVCHYRVAARDTRVGLPELKLGVIPLSGTQRLPRVLGLAHTIDLVLGSKLMLAEELERGGLFDLLLDGDAEQVIAAAVQFACSEPVRAARNRGQLPLIRNRIIEDADPDRLLAEARAALGSDDVMLHEGLNAIAASIEAPDFDHGMAVARAIHERLAASDYVREQKERFFGDGS